MATHAVDDLAARAKTDAGEITGYWWLWLISGIFWVIAALVVLQFDKASITTVGVLTGLLFLFSSVQQFIISAVATGWARWLAVAFGVLLAAAGIVALAHPKNTFAGVADILGFIFLLIGTFWIIQSLMERDVNDLWWLGLISGILLVMLAFWTSGQFFINKAYTLLIFVGIWALTHGITDLIRAFQVRRLHKELT
jgi:uncharacterized membrane protein HdeD (DUF308 family)